MGTSPRPDVAARFAGRNGFVYGITTRGLSTVDVNGVLGTSWEFAWQQEIVVPGTIPWENVLFYYPAPVWGP